MVGSANKQRSPCCCFNLHLGTIRTQAVPCGHLTPSQSVIHHLLSCNDLLVLVRHVLITIKNFIYDMIITRL